MMVSSCDYVLGTNVGAISPLRVIFERGVFLCLNPKRLQR